MLYIHIYIFNTGTLYLSPDTADTVITLYVYNRYLILVLPMYRLQYLAPDIADTVIMLYIYNGYLIPVLLSYSYLAL